MVTKTKGCTPISVEVAILTPDDKHEIHFGLTKGCNPDDSVFWIVDFILKEDKNGQMKTRIEVHVHVGKDKTKDAASLADSKELSQENIDLLNGPAFKRAKKLTPGTPQDTKLNNLVVSAVSGN
ncbi:MAG TPA: hypothetical protein VJT71_19030 [Pyrinomonadaceae bacterium]|nr:hypothetical protein [Pyrinomonadaceae bacterium]